MWIFCFTNLELYTAVLVSSICHVTPRTKCEAIRNVPWNAFIKQLSSCLHVGLYWVVRWCYSEYDGVHGAQTAALSLQRMAGWGKEGWMFVCLHISLVKFLDVCLDIWWALLQQCCNCLVRTVLLQASRLFRSRSLWKKLGKNWRLTWAAPPNVCFSWVKMEDQ